MDIHERIRRFWSAHGTSATHLVVLHAFFVNPRLQRTPEGLALWYGLPLDRVRLVCSEFAECDILRSLPGKISLYQWNPALRWADPRQRPGSSIFLDRWIAETRASVPPAGAHRTKEV